MPFKDPDRRREYDRQRYRDRHVPRRDPSEPPKWVSRDDYVTSVRIPRAVVAELRRNEMVESARERRDPRSFNKIIIALIETHNDLAPHRQNRPAF